MNRKKRIILALAILLLVVNIINLVTVLTITGKTTGSLAMCINQPPAITTIADQTATVGTAFSLNVIATDADSDTLTYYDDTSLFNINSLTGAISFTPSAAGTYSITITVEDNSTCPNSNSTDTFTLTISAAGETPGGAGPGGGGGGGGGAPPVEEVPETSLDIGQDTIKVVLKQSESLTKSTTISNDGETTVDVKISNPMSKVLDLSPDSFTLSPGEDQEVTLIFNPNKDAKADIYQGFLKVSGSSDSGSVSKGIATVLEIESEEVLFDASIDLNGDSFSPGDNVKATISVYNIRGIGSAEVELSYSLSDLDGNVIFSDEESINIEKQASFTKDFVIPNDAKAGDYVFAVRVNYKDSFGSATELLKVKLKVNVLQNLAGQATAFASNPFNLIVLVAILIFVTLIFITLYALHKRTKKAKTIIHQNRIVHQNKTIRQYNTKIIKQKPRTIIKNKTIRKIFRPVIVQQDDSVIRRKLSLLKESYDRGYISEKSYKNSKGKLEKYLN